MKSKRLILIVAGLAVVVAAEVVAWWYFTSKPAASAAPQPAGPAAKAEAPADPGVAVPGVGPNAESDSPVPPLPAPKMPVFSIATSGPNKGKPLPGPMPAPSETKGPTPIPGNPDAKGEITPEQKKIIDEKYRAALVCSGAADAKIPLKDYILRERASPNRGAPTQVGPRVSYPGFPVVVYTHSGSREKVMLGVEARKALVAAGICTWALPMVVIPSVADGAQDPFQGQSSVEVYVPVAAPESPPPPLKAGVVEGGLAYVGKPVPVTKTRPDDLARFQEQVRASGAVPRGPLLARHDDQGTFGPDDDTVQFIQPITAP